jgi:isopentenyl diphosphate isomerase/L-lactate dehydrogenase-like FMN-dependent dehydrogenase
MSTNLEYGAADIIVFSHGGRQLNGVLPGIEALPKKYKTCIK